MIRALLTAAYLLLLASLWLLPADARMHYPARGHRILPANAAPPLDGLTATSGAYGFRKLRSAYAGPGVKLQRVDTTTADIGFLGCTSFTGCPLDTVAATAFCTTACTIRTWYDQSGLGRDLQQLTAAAQLNFVFNCNGALPCARALGVVGQSAFGASVTPATGVSSFSAVSMLGTLGAGTPTCNWINQGPTNNRLSSFAANWFLSAGGNVQAVPTPAVNVWHTQQGVVNGASSVINVDGVETTGSLAGVATAGSAIIGYASTLGTVCSFAEAIVWDNYVLTAGERAFLRSNQSGYWGTP